MYQHQTQTTKTKFNLFHINLTSKLRINKHHSLSRPTITKSLWLLNHNIHG